MKQKGVTIIEMMVSIVIGMGLIAVLLAVFSTSSGANRASDAQAQMNEDAQFALQLLAKQIRLADYRDPTPPVPPAVISPGTLNAPLYAIFGCDNGFSNASGTSAAVNTVALTCNTNALTGGHGLLISYHADSYNSTMLTGLPTDCIGNTRAFAAANFSLIENRFFVDSTTNTLSCAGNGGTPFQAALPLVENVERLEFAYGVSNAGTNSVVGYRTSAELGAATAAVVAANWPRVTSVRICVVMRSQYPVLDSNEAYYFPCNPHANNAIKITDKYARKAYSMTVALRNRL